MARVLIFAGIILVLIGIFWPWLSRLPLGQLPGDIVIQRENFSFYFPITTMILASLVLSLVFWIFSR